jgi:hypothetical protein
VPCRVIYGHLLSYRYPQPYFTFVSCGYFAAIRHDSSLVHLFESDQCAVQLSSSIDEGGGKRRSTSNKSRTKIAKPSAASWAVELAVGESPHLVSPSCVEKGLIFRFHEQCRQKVLNLSGASAVYRVVF